MDGRARFTCDKFRACPHPLLRPGTAHIWPLFVDLYYHIDAMLSARRMYTAALALCLVPLTWAIQADLAGVVDWHKELIGEPLLEPTPPKFVDTSAGRRVIALTKSNVLAALDADTGDVGKSLREGKPKARSLRMSSDRA